MLSRRLASGLPVVANELAIRTLWGDRSASAKLIAVLCRCEILDWRTVRSALVNFGSEVVLRLFGVLIAIRVLSSH